MAQTNDQKAAKLRMERAMSKAQILSPNKRRKAATRIAILGEYILRNDLDLEAGKPLLDALKYLDLTDPSTDGDQVRKAFRVEEGRVHKSDLTDADRENMDEVQDWIEGQDT